MNMLSKLFKPLAKTVAGAVLTAGIVSSAFSASPPFTFNLKPSNTLHCSDQLFSGNHFPVAAGSPSALA